MDLEPYDWNVVVLGAWNPAILTPAGIARRLFDLPPGTPVGVEVPIDGIGPIRVRVEGLMVNVLPPGLHINTEKPSFETLKRAMSIAHIALKRLPETPLVAAGFNVRYRTMQPPDALISVTQANLDNLLSDDGYKIVGRELTRSLNLEDGRINVTISSDGDGTWSLLFNFDRRSGDRDMLMRWLETPIGLVEEHVGRLLRGLGYAQGVPHDPDQRDGRAQANPIPAGDPR